MAIVAAARKQKRIGCVITEVDGNCRKGWTDQNEIVEEKLLKAKVKMIILRSDDFDNKVYFC